MESIFRSIEIGCIALDLSYKEYLEYREQHTKDLGKPVSIKQYEGLKVWFGSSADDIISQAGQVSQTEIARREDLYEAAYWAFDARWKKVPMTTRDAFKTSVRGLVSKIEKQKLVSEQLIDLVGRLAIFLDRGDEQAWLHLLAHAPASLLKPKLEAINNEQECKQAYRDFYSKSKAEITFYQWAAIWNFVQERLTERTQQKDNVQELPVVVDFQKQGFKDRVFSGWRRGKLARKEFEVDKLDNLEVKVNVVIPEDLYCLTKSFFLGMFGPTLKAMKSKLEFKEKYNLVGPAHILEEIDEYIDIEMRRLLEVRK